MWDDDYDIDIDRSGTGKSYSVHQPSQALPLALPHIKRASQLVKGKWKALKKTRLIGYKCYTARVSTFSSPYQSSPLPGPCFPNVKQALRSLH